MKPPTIIDVSPIDGSAGVSVNSPIVAKFSDPILGSTVITDTFVIKNKAGNSWEGKRSLANDNKSIGFEPHPFHSGTTIP